MIKRLFKNNTETHRPVLSGLCFRLLFFFFIPGITIFILSACSDNKEENEGIPEPGIEVDYFLPIIDYLFYYEVNLPISYTDYVSTTLLIETDKIAEKFGISANDLLDGIAGKSKAPKIKCFAIQGSTYARYIVASNTNSVWGHWWDMNGDVITWNENNASVYNEFDTETGMFTIGQYPGRLTDEQTIRFIEGLEYNSMYIGIAVSITAKDTGLETGTIIGTQKLHINVNPRSDYNTDTLHFDMTRILSNLGVSSIDEVKFIAVSSDGSLTNDYNAGDTGFWYNLNGFTGQWSDDDACIYTSFETDDNSYNYIGIGQKPNILTEGDEVTIKYGFMAKNKIEMLEITVMVTTLTE
ncbi:MAG: DUF4859 domain-containing protein [Tannerella sp.]|jgi:hypothetical protein|nr:DUF4859 domain-containing protein [Tannerella sp.]